MHQTFISSTFYIKYWRIELVVKLAVEALITSPIINHHKYP